MENLPAPRQAADPSPEVDGRRLVVFVVPDVIDDLVGTRSTAGLVRVGQYGCRSAAWSAVLRYGLSRPTDPFATEARR